MPVKNYLGTTYTLTDKESLFLDFLRGMAAQLVLIGHAIGYFRIAYTLQPPNFPYMQNIAVICFFILSGYVISYSTFTKAARGSYYFYNFLIDRFSRIFCAFVPGLFVVFLVDYLSIYLQPEVYRYYNAFNVATWISNLFMLQDFPYNYQHLLGIKVQTSFASGRPFWTIAIEWWLYVFFGILYFSLKIKEQANLLIKLMLFIPATLVVYFNFVGGRGHGLSICWLFGILICLFYPLYKQLWQNKSRVLMQLLFLILLFFLGKYSFKIISGSSFTIVYGRCFSLIIALAIMVSLHLFNYVKSIGLFNWFIKKIAGYSFTLYLIHYSLLDFLSNYLGYGLAKFIFSFLLINLLSYLIANFTEKYLTQFVKLKLNNLLHKAKRDVSVQAA